MGDRFQVVRLLTWGAGIAGLTVGLFATLLSAAAQQPAKMSRIGVLATLPRPAPDSSSPYNVFLRELRTLGHVEGQNITIAWHHTEANPERRRREAATLVAWKPDVVLAAGELEVKALNEVDPKVPIVVAGASDLVAAGLVRSLAQPRTNVTGIHTISGDLIPKRLELLKELIPQLQRVAMLYDPRRGAATSNQAGVFAAADTAAKQLSVRLQRFAASSGDDLDRIFPDMKRGAEAALVMSNQFTVAHRQRIIDLAARHRLPTMYDFRTFVEVGGLVSYGSKLSENYRRAAQLVDRILKGAKPSDIPVEQPMELELLINMKTAKALGLTISPLMLGRAEQVSE
jgi:putative ABC transport system substrate-binding protein